MKLQFDKLTGTTVGVSVMTEKETFILGYIKNGAFTIHWNFALQEHCDDRAQVMFTLPAELLGEIATYKI
jgi:hypothetical protein